MKRQVTQLSVLDAGFRKFFGRDADVRVHQFGLRAFGLRRLRLRGGLLVLGLVLGGGTLRAEPAGRIPELNGISFSEQAVRLPQDLQGKVGVLVVGFSQGSRDAVTAWGKRLAVDYASSPTVAFYELPVLEGVPRFLRGMVTGKIKSSVSERGKPHFVPILENGAAWRALAQYKGGDAAYVMVVDGTGVVRWQSHDAFSEAVYGAMQREVEGLRGR